MKTAVVFYSLDGNCAFVAQEIKTRLNAEVVQLYTQDEKKRGGFAKLLWGGGMVFMKKKPPLKPYAFDLAAYDLIVIGVPVWAGSPAPPVQTFLSRTGIAGKKIALFVCHGGGMGKALKKFRALFPNNDIIAEADFCNPAVKDRENAKQKIADWVNGFTKT